MATSSSDASALEEPDEMVGGPGGPGNHVHAAPQPEAQLSAVPAADVAVDSPEGKDSHYHTPVGPSAPPSEPRDFAEAPEADGYLDGSASAAGQAVPSYVAAPASAAPHYHHDHAASFSSSAAAAGDLAPVVSKEPTAFNVQPPNPSAAQRQEERKRVAAAAAQADERKLAEGKAEAKEALLQIEIASLPHLIDLIKAQLKKHRFAGLGSSFGAASKVYTLIGKLENESYVYLAKSQYLGKNPFLSDETMRLINATFNHTANKDLAPIYAFMRHYLVLLPYMGKVSPSTLESFSELADTLYQFNINLPKTGVELRFIADHLARIDGIQRCLNSIRWTTKPITDAHLRTLVKLMMLHEAKQNPDHCRNFDAEYGLFKHLTRLLTPSFTVLMNAGVTEDFCFQTLINNAEQPALTDAYADAFAELKKYPHLDTQQNRELLTHPPGPKLQFDTLLKLDVNKLFIDGQTQLLLRAVHPSTVFEQLRSLKQQGLKLEAADYELILAMLAFVPEGKARNDAFAEIANQFLTLKSRNILNDKTRALIRKMPWQKVPSPVALMKALTNALHILQSAAMLEALYPTLEQYIVPRFYQYATVSPVSAEVIELAFITELVKLRAHFDKPEVQQPLLDKLKQPVHYEPLPYNLKNGPVPRLLLDFQYIVPTINRIYAKNLVGNAKLNPSDLINDILSNPGCSSSLVNGWESLNEIGILDESYRKLLAEDAWSASMLAGGICVLVRDLGAAAITPAMINALKANPHQAYTVAETQVRLAKEQAVLSNPVASASEQVSAVESSSVASASASTAVSMMSSAASSSAAAAVSASVAASDAHSAGVLFSTSLFSHLDQAPLLPVSEAQETKIAAAIQALPVAGSPTVVTL